LFYDDALDSAAARDSGRFQRDVTQMIEWSNNERKEGDWLLSFLFSNPLWQFLFAAVGII